MRADPIVEEVRRVRDAYAAQFNYDVEALFADLLAKQQASGREYVSFAERKAPTAAPTSVAPNEANEVVEQPQVH